MDFKKACAAVGGDFEDTKDTYECYITDHTGVTWHKEDKTVIFGWTDKLPHPTGWISMGDIKHIKAIKTTDGEYIMEVRSSMGQCAVDKRGTIEAEF